MDRSAVAVKQRHVSRYRPFLFLGQNKSKEAAPANVPYPGTGLKGRTDGLTDGLASKHIPSYQQKHRIKILKHLSATFTC